MSIPSSQSGAAVPLAVLISGSGRTMLNFQSRIDDGTLSARIAVVISDRPDCSGVDKARHLGLPVRTFERQERNDITRFSSSIFETCREAGAELVTLAGFLSRIEIPEDFEDRVMNIHPSLIPAFCGEGMYGSRVHQGVFERGCKVSGCTVHFADNQYDNGPIIVQQCVDVADAANAEAIADRVFAAECEAYPLAINLFAAARLRIDGRRVHILPPA